MRFLGGLALLAGVAFGFWWCSDSGQAALRGPVCQSVSWAAVCHGGYPAVPAGARR